MSPEKLELSLTKLAKGVLGLIEEVQGIGVSFQLNESLVGSQATTSAVLMPVSAIGRDDFDETLVALKEKLLFVRREEIEDEFDSMEDPTTLVEVPLHAVTALNAYLEPVS